MTNREQIPGDELPARGVNPGYAAFQLARALTTAEHCDDPETRQRARDRVSKWETVLTHILTGTVEYGSRTPVAGVPGWATLEVVTGGFATGQLLAAGPIQEHEKLVLATIPGVPAGQERRGLNAWYLSGFGLAELSNRLMSGCYDVGVPEEGALMVVAWLVQKGYVEDARKLLDELSPYFPKLRFYPIPLEQPRRSAHESTFRTWGKRSRICGGSSRTGESSLRRKP